MEARHQPAPARAYASIAETAAPVLLVRADLRAGQPAESCQQLDAIVTTCE